jgi:hypothetical protein
MTLPWGREPLHTILAWARGPMRVLTAIVEIATLAMFDPGQALALRRSVALELLLSRQTGLGSGHPPTTPVGSSTAGVAVGAPSASSAPMGETVAESRAGDPAVLTGLWIGALAPGRLDGTGRDLVAAGMDGQRTFFTPLPARNPAPGKLFRPVSRACTGGLFALKMAAAPPFDIHHSHAQTTRVQFARSTS